MQAKNVVCFDISKNERFQITDNYKMLYRKLKAQWKVEQNDVELVKDRLAHVNVFVLAGPQERFTQEEFDVLKEFVENGGSLLVLLGEGGEVAYKTNINFFLEQYGMNINNDVVVRPHYYKNFHPKECTIGGGVVCESMARHLLKLPITILDLYFNDEKLKIHFEYPYGATLNVYEPANILLTTGPVVYPFNRALAGYYRNEKGGKILAIGSCYMFSDKYLTDKSNEAILDYCFQLLGSDEIKFTHLDFDNIEINENKTFTDTQFLASFPRACLIDPIGRDLPTDFKKMFITKLYGLSNCLLPAVMETYEKLNVKFEDLKIIKPQFEIPLPALQLATFPPVFSEPAAPALELFDLEEPFSPPRIQLAKMTGKCIASLQNRDTRKPVNLNELQNYIKECAHITGIINETQDIAANEILNIVAQKIINYKPYSDE